MGRPPRIPIALALVAFATAGACAGPTRGHLGPTTSTQPEATLLYADGSGQARGGEPLDTTTAPAGPATPAPQAGAAVPEAASGTSPPCTSPLRLPDQVDGYTLTPGDSAALSLIALPPGLQGTGFEHVARGDGAVVDLVSVSGAGYVFGDTPDASVLDRFARSAGISGQPEPVSVGTYRGVVARMSTGSTMYAWMPCRSTVIAVVGRDGAMAADVAARVSR